ncbi:hypothetical protein [Actinokineospora globicatena]|uniref:hypothetical protein n=1 Tax=Actinokineospora globicatena TaxID=103729 RepID=UPI0020A3AABD|nr:hypothetical protein [Actinokineospora globicatena]MCP2304079.1 hypothetical protein [Actinokineospora globicatena]GLW78571.1 hypothetical protein Aglo01_30530 [Actinokineospora globicatena]GLW84762.1 hypothetical protein Aglo02_24020 [Actinokineospora globicatena]
MTPSDRRIPRRRADSTHPADSRPGGRRGGDRRPWPTASGTTRVSPAKPTADTTRTRTAAAPATPTPATVWPAGATSIPLDAAWPVALVDRIVTSFSAPGARVVLLAETARDQDPLPAWIGSGGVIDHAPDTEPESGLAEAYATVEDLDRTPRIERLPLPGTASADASRPFWADLVTDSTPTVSGPVAPTAAAASPEGLDATVATADLVIASLPPGRRGVPLADIAALIAARLLRVGGVFVVLTHCDWRSGRLTDPTGDVVAAGQTADLLYLQHIVALHAPVRHGGFLHPDPDPDGQDRTGGEVAEAHRARVRGLPAPHRRIHSDLLVFAQPHEHRAPALSPTAAVSRDGDAA